MLDLNYLLLFIALASPLILLWRLARLGKARPAGWVAPALIVLAVSGISWMVVPPIAGYVAGGFWALLLLMPALAERKIADLLLQKRYGAARRVALVRRTLHPGKERAELSSLLRALELANAGRLTDALDCLAARRSADTPAGRAAIACTYALTENWPGLVGWVRGDATMTRDPAVRTLYRRALGETGALDELAAGFAARSQDPESRLTSSPQFAQELLYLFAFAGRTGAIVRLFRSVLARYPQAHQQFWLATAELAEGRKHGAVTRLTNLRGATGDAILERSIARRMTQANEFPAARFAPEAERTISRLVRATGEGSLHSSPRQPIAVWAFIFLNVVMFGAEMIMGGATNGLTLHRLGALEPDAVLVQHQYWRLLTALFLHYGVLHILINLYALYLLGPALERLIGPVRFALGYLLAGLGSSAGVVLLRVLGLTKADQLVGASGCVMGIIGISAGLLLGHRQSPLAGRRLREILAIVLFQTLFDLSSPQVSLSAHLSGFAAGVLLGLFFAKRRSAPRAAA